ncbi:MAG: DUF2007 domain-containing protein [Flavobacteriales bacterium]
MDDWSTVRYYQNALEANYARCLIEAEGIPVFLKDEHIISTNPMWATTLGGIKLQVPTARKSEAEELIRSRENEPFEDPEEGSSPTCASCGSHDLEGPFTTLRTKRGWLGYLVGVLAFSYPMNYDRVYQCRVCQARTPLS